MNKNREIQVLDKEIHINEWLFFINRYCKIQKSVRAKRGSQKLVKKKRYNRIFRIVGAT